MTDRSARHDDTTATPERFPRRLVAIAFADVVGYSTRMSQHEDRTHARWMAILRETIEPRLAAHRGTLVKSTGDGVLVEFAGVLNAVGWSRDVQGALREYNHKIEDEVLCLQLRIAVHLCDVIEESTDIFGDGVNIAARLQEHAPPGGVVVSETVHDIVRVAIDLEAKSLGYLKLKNIATPVHAFLIDSDRIETDGGIGLPANGLPSIAVLPLQDFSAPPQDTYFGDGIVEDIIVSLAGLREILVISRASTLAYGEQRPDPRDVGRTLGVTYVLMGTVRRSERLVRVSFQLCDAQSGANLWADTSECEPGELFDVQDRIVGRVVAGIAPNVRALELRQALRKRPENFSAYDHTLRALECIHSLDRPTFERAREFLEQAMAIDPNFAMPVAWTGRWYSLSIGQGWSADPGADAAIGSRFAGLAIELDHQNALALATFGHMKSFLFHDYDSAQVYLERARTACPSSSLAWVLSSATASYVGRCDEAVLWAERGLRLSPYDRSLFYSYFFLGLAHYSAGTYEQAVKWGRISESENPLYTANLRILTASLVASGQVDHAREVARRLLRLEPNFSITSYINSRQPFQEGRTMRHYLDHLRQAGFKD